jgi:WD40 repeat protein
MYINRIVVTMGNVCVCVCVCLCVCLGKNNPGDYYSYSRNGFVYFSCSTRFKSSTISPQKSQHSMDGEDSTAISWDVNYLIATSAGNVINLWNGESCARVGSLMGAHASDYVCSLQFSRDNRMLASAGGIDKLVIIWDMTNFSELARLDHDVIVSMAKFSMCGQKVITEAYLTFHIWDWAARSIIHRVSTIKAKYSSFTVLPSESFEMLFIGREPNTSDNNQIIRWNCDINKESNRLQLPTTISSCSLCPSNHAELAALSSGDTVYIIDMITGNIMSELRTSVLVYSLSYSSDGYCVMMVSQNQTIVKWDKLSSQAEVVADMGEYVHGAAFSPDDRRFIAITGSDEMTVCEGSHIIARLWGQNGGDAHWSHPSQVILM